MNKESLQGEITQREIPRERQKNVLESMHEKVLLGESYEDASAALESVKSIQDFRKKLRDVPFGSFHELVEGITTINKLPNPPEEKQQRMKAALELLKDQIPQFSPRVADLYLGLLADIEAKPYESHFAITREKIAELQKEGDLEVLFSGETSWQIKFNRIETRLTDYLLGMRAFDKREGKEMDDDIRMWREEELKKALTRPPQRRNESKPGVDPMERLKEGERVPAIWSIYPAWGGYYKEQSFSKWDGTRNVWVEDEYVYREAEKISLSGNTDHKKGPIDLTLSAQISAGSWITLPVPYTHGLYHVEAGERPCLTQQDQNGDIVIFIEGDGACEIKVLLAPHPEKKITSDPKTVHVPEIPAEFSKETDNTLEEIKNKKQGNIAKARALASYTRSHLSYLAPKDRIESEYYNTFYNTHPKGFAGAVDEIKKADCDVANTYFAALCANSGIPVRHVIGHSVKGKDANGASSINSGTGHGWSEVWDEVKKEWVRMDATPPGDPNLKKDEDNVGGSAAPGDYGGQQAIRPSDEELEELRKKLAEHAEKLSYTPEERQLAQAAGIEVKEARAILEEIKEAESARLSNGELVVDVLKQLFDAIAESRKKELPAYSGPVRRREGGENISHIINHYIGMQAGDPDPMSRDKPATEIKEEKLLNGMDVYIIGDKSGSMFFEESKEGKSLWKMQRRFEYLLFSSLYRFDRELQKAHLSSDKALDVRTMGISFRGDSPEDIDVDKPLSSRFAVQDKVNMWHSLGEAGSGNGDVTAIKHVYQKIKEEKEEMVRQGSEDHRMRIVIAYSDGGYVNKEAEMRAWAEEMSKLRVVVVGIGLTESAVSVPVVMHNPPKSFGEIVSNLDELTVATAKYIVLQAIKLFPDKAREDA